MLKRDEERKNTSSKNKLNQSFIKQYSKKGISLTFEFEKKETIICDQTIL